MIPIDILLAWGATYKKARQGEIIFNEGAEAHFYYQLIIGSIRWVNITDDGREFVQHLVLPGETFGEIPLFDNLPYAATAIASSDSLILRLQKSTFLQLIKEEGELHLRFTTLLAQRMRFRFLISKELAYKDPEHRISTLFDYLKKERKFFCCDCSKIQLTRQQIADMTGLRVETVIRAIKNLQHKGWLSIEKGKVYY